MVRMPQVCADCLLVYNAQEHQRERAMREISLSKIAFLLAMVLSWGCCDSRSFTEVDSWYAPVPGGVGPYTSGISPIDDANMHEVVGARLTAAEAFLKDVSCVEISVEQAAELTGKPLPQAEGAKLFLVRGVCLRRDTGRFAVYVKGTELLVHHGCLGTGPVPMNRQPLVVQVQKRPVRVYVTCSMAE